MSILGAIGAGIAEAAGTINTQAMEQIKADIEQNKQQRLQETAAELARGNIDYSLQAQENLKVKDRARKAEFAKPVKGFESPEAGIIASNAGATDPNSRGDENIGANVQDTVHAPTARESQARAAAAGDTESYKTYGDEADKGDKLKVDAEHRKSQDAQWKASHDELVRYHKASLGQQAAELDLKKTDKKELDSAIQAVSIANANYEMLPKTASEEVKNAAKLAADNARLKVAQFGLKLPGVEEGKLRYQWKNLGDAITPDWRVVDAQTGTSKSANGEPSGNNRASQFRVIH